MLTVCFVGNYPPIRCGIADFTSYITRTGLAEDWRTLSFTLDREAVPGDAVTGEDVSGVWYGIPDAAGMTVPVVKRGLETLGCNGDSVLWVQHEFNIWTDSRALVETLRGLDIPKVVTLHTLHFQSGETPSGLCRREHDFLRALLPHVDAITVFSRGVRHAVNDAFPEHSHKVHVIRHGTHLYPEVSRLSRTEAKRRLGDYLIQESDLDEATKSALGSRTVFSDPDTVVVGQTGFLHPIKGSEFLFAARDRLQQLLPERRVVALRIGKARQAEHRGHLAPLRRVENKHDKFLLELLLPQEMLPLAQRAFDVNYYWPTDCTQSGILSHALGTGALIAGRDLEGVGETLRAAGALCDTDQEGLLRMVAEVLRDDELRRKIEQAGIASAVRYGWTSQARRHRELARGLFAGLPAEEATAPPVKPSGRTGDLLARVRRQGQPLVPWHLTDGRPAG